MLEFLLESQPPWRRRRRGDGEDTGSTRARQRETTSSWATTAGQGLSGASSISEGGSHQPQRRRGLGSSLFTSAGPLADQPQMCPVTFFQTKTVKRLLKPHPPPAIFFIRLLPNIPHFAFFIQKTCISFYSSQRQNHLSQLANRPHQLAMQCGAIAWERILCSLGRHYTDIMLANVVPLSLHATSGIYQYIPTTRYSNEQI